MFTDGFERGEGYVFTEADWNITASEKKFPYFYSKRRAEEVSVLLVTSQRELRSEVQQGCQCFRSAVLDVDCTGQQHGLLQQPYAAC